MKRISSWILSISLVFTLGMSPALATFRDVPAEASYAQAVQWLENVGAIHSNALFEPANPLTRAEFLKMAFAAADVDAGGFPSSAPAPDVEQKVWYSPYVAKALEWGLFDLDPDGLFRPQKPVSRAEALRAAMKLWGLGVPVTVPEGVEFADVRAGAWYGPYIYKAEQLGIINTEEDGMTRPLERLNRGQGAELLYDTHVAVENMNEFGEEIPSVQIQIGAGSGYPRIDQLANILQMLQSGYLYDDKIDADQMGIAAITGMVESLEDPYTQYIPPAMGDSFEQSLENEVVGIGAHVSMENGQLTIISPVPGGPADTAGIIPKDVITHVDGTDISKMSKMEAISLIRGKEGTPVKITVYRPDTGQTLDFTIIRKLIDLPDTTVEMLDLNHALIRINQFTPDTPAEFNEIVEELKNNPNLTGIVLDLRNNPGGFLDETLRIASNFLEQGEVITSTRDKNGNGQRYTVAEDGDLAGIPVAILVNEGSASAAEIMAGAIAGNDHGKLIGTKTYGKGTAQQFSQFDDGSYFKMTVAEWLLPNGTSINLVGIEPDVNIPLNRNAAQDNQLQQALTELRRM